MAAVINSMSDAAVVMIHNTQAAWGRETYKLVKTVQKMYPVIQFLKDRYFPDGPVYYSEKALIEFKKKGRKIAPFVIPLINGIVMEKDGYRTDIVDAPYIAPKCVITAKELEKKAFGESPESGRSPEQRENEIESECIDDNRKAILRRHEQMCAELLLTGQVMMKHYATAEDAARGENYDLKYLR
ncbi:major capsid protein [Eubacterium sp. MSJ-13]|nr:major capsid protein [Eubacterium sp. MSJ-13]